MKRLVLLAFIGCSFLALNPINAQKLNVGLNGAVAFPLGDFGDLTSLGFGGDISLDYYFNDKFDLGIEAGYKPFLYESSLADGETFNIIPIQLTAGYHTDIDDWIDLYGELGGGIFIASSSLGGESMTSAGISPRVGAAFELSSTWFLDVNLNYTYVFSEETTSVSFTPNYNWLGLNVGILYTIGEY